MARVIYYKGKPVKPEDLNVWGTPKEAVGEGFCRECERENPYHYNNCPLYVSPLDELPIKPRGCPECGSTGAHRKGCSRRKAAGKRGAKK